ncbi:fungal cellulose binding domain-containing protein [Ilyonectria robusta]
MRFSVIATALAAFATSSTLATDRTYLFTFGDSYTRTLWKINGPVPSEQNPIGNPPLPGGTSSGGKNWVGLLVTKFNVSSVFLYNFASSGAPIDKTLLAPQPLLSDRVDFVNQVQLFNKTLSAAPSWAPWTAQNSIAAMWLNVKDLRDTLDYPNTPEIYKRVMKRYMEQVERLYAMGVRNFIFLTAPPGRFPDPPLAEGELPVRETVAPGLPQSLKLSLELNGGAEEQEGITPRTLQVSGETFKDVPRTRAGITPREEGSRGRHDARDDA